MKILYHTNEFFSNQIVPEVLTKWRERLRFGFEAISLQSINSLNSNARLIIDNAKTAESKIYRVVRTMYFDRLFPRLLTNLQIVERGDVVNVDFSDFGGRQVLMFAKQTGEGRAIPLYFDFIKYPIEKGSQNTFIIESAKNFFQLVPEVKLVFDRGFAVPSLITFLAEQSTIFYIRIKRGKSLVYKDLKRIVSQLARRDVRGNIYGLKLRIIQSQRRAGQKEPWYIVTNDFESDIEDIIQIYYRRFEIEEYFKDTKRLANLEYFRNVSDRTFKTVLWFLVLGLWAAWMCQEIRRAWQEQRQTTPSHQWLSLMRYWWENLAKELRISKGISITLST